jgi:hypothetical protein
MRVEQGDACARLTRPGLLGPHQAGVFRAGAGLFRDGSLLGASMGPYRDSEQALARDLLEQGCFGPGMLVLADQKFLSWALALEFLATGARILWRASASSPSSR